MYPPHPDDSATPAGGPEHPVPVVPPGPDRTTEGADAPLGGARWPGPGPAEDALEYGLMGPVPDLRRDALEEAAETSPEARERVQALDRREAAVDPAFERPDR